MIHHERPYQPIENYGIIGNLQTTALVSLKGSIDFMAFPEFDSPTVFASILDSKKGGYFAVEPELPDFTTKQLYLPGTAVLITRFFSESGVAELTDYMPLPDNDGKPRCALVRNIKTIRGRITFKVHCVPRFNYAAGNHESSISDNGITFTSLDDNTSKLRLIADTPLQLQGNDGYAEFTLDQSESAVIVLEEVSVDNGSNGIEAYSRSMYEETVSKWRNWIRRSSYRGYYPELIFRSAITLKLLTSAAYGSVIAAPTFGLPEVIGGDRNWDYRYTWIRDAAFTMYIFLALGFDAEMAAFMNWIEKFCSDDQLQLVYSYEGNSIIKEQELKYLDGYRGSKPVRIGNAASSQYQVDIFGELIDTVYIFNKSYKAITYQFWLFITKLISRVISDWKKPDHGIWEIRSTKKEFLHSRLMCWVAMDRAIKIADNRSFPYPALEWRTVRDEIYRDIYDNFWNTELEAWVQYKGARNVDASVLMMPLTHFISAFEPRWLSTMDAIEKELKLDVLIYRYRNLNEKADGIAGEEGTFNICSFWYIECLAKSGKLDEAVESFEKMIGYANHLGLFSEELGKKGEHLGNFPQAFTHLALVSAALELNKQLGRVRGHAATY